MRLAGRLRILTGLDGASTPLGRCSLRTMPTLVWSTLLERLVAAESAGPVEPQTIGNVPAALGAHLTDRRRQARPPVRPVDGRPDHAGSDEGPCRVGPRRWRAGRLHPPPCWPRRCWASALTKPGVRRREAARLRSSIAAPSGRPPRGPRTDDPTGQQISVHGTGLRKAYPPSGFIRSRSPSTRRSSCWPMTRSPIWDVAAAYTRSADSASCGDVSAARAVVGPLVLPGTVELPVLRSSPSDRRGPGLAGGGSAAGRRADPAPAFLTGAAGCLAGR